MTRLDSTAILASAGSGKTFVLTSRFLALLLAGVAPERILAVTFSRAAASEILKRLLERLAPACESEANAAALGAELATADTIPVPAISAGACRRALRVLLDASHRLSVCTIDSFFARIAGAMSLDLDLPPGWTVTDETTEAMSRERAVEEVVRGLDPGETARLVRLLHKGLYSSRVFDAMLDAITSCHAAFLEGDEDAWGQIGPESAPLTPTAIAAALKALADVALPVSASTGAVNGHWSKAHRGDLARAMASDWEAFLSTGLASAVAEKKDTFQRVPLPDAVQLAYTPLIEHARAVLLSTLRTRNLATLDAVRRFHTEHEGLRRRLGQCSFDDIPRALLRADAAGDLESLYYTLDGRLDHALVDEFQDTSTTQFRLLEPLLAEMVSDPSGARSVMCVGDVKQSLYQWRNAEPELLPWLGRHWSSMTERPLDVSYRSSPEVIEAANSVFSSLDGNPAMTGSEAGQLAARQWQSRFHEHQTRVTTPGRAALIVTNAVAGDDHAHIERCADHIARIAHDYPGESIGVLLPRRKRMAQLLVALRARHVDAIVESGAGVTDSAAVGAVLSLLRLADFPGNTAAAFHVATSPLGPVVGLSHPVPPVRADEVAETVRRQLASHGYARTIATWCEAVRDSCDARDQERLSRLTELAERYDAAAGLRPSGFVEFAAGAKLDDAGAAQVRILTVHGSKGLEFATVVLPDLGDDLKPAHPAGVLLERASPLAPITAVTRYPSAVVRSAHPQLEAMYLAQAARAIGERLSVLYVAMTRARTRLDMLVPPSAFNTWPATFAGVLHGALNQNASRQPGAVLWSRGDTAPARPAPSPPQPTRTTGIERPPTIRLAPGSGRATRATPLSPSRMTISRPRTVADAFEPGAPAWTRARGTLIHAWMEHIEWLDDPPLTADLLRTTCDAEGVPWTSATESLAYSVMNALKAGAVRDLLTRHATAARHPAGSTLEALRERPIAARATAPGESHPGLLVGRIDRLVIARRDGHPVSAEIIDYKTQTAPEPEAELIDAYGPQLRAYRSAVSAMLSLPPDRVRCCVALVLLNRVIWVD